MSQQGPAGVGEFIQRQASARNPGEDRQHAGASGWLEHQVVIPKPRRLRDDGRKR